MQTCDIGFVILHYNAMDETIDCVESIQMNIDTQAYQIIIVDNASPNGSGKKLEEKYENQNKIEVICCDENLGFAKGNNVGIDFLRGKYAAAFICCLNNDTLLESKDFYQKILEQYRKTQDAVLGPRILLKDGTEQVFDYKVQNIEYYRELKQKYEEMDKSVLYDLKMRLLDIPFVAKINQRKKERKAHVQQPQITHVTDIMLHGCCLIFTPIFFDHLKGFNPNTFLYREEELLSLALQKNHLHNRYFDGVTIRHMEDASTNTIVKGRRMKERFVRQNHIRSLEILISEMECENS